MFNRIAISLLAAGLLSSGSALAIVGTARSYVASYGDDANTATNCAPTAPCRTFTAAMGITVSGGQIIVLDSAGYGSVTFDRSVSIIAPDGIYAGLTAASGNVVTIAIAGVNATLKGLTITGGTNGISMTNGNRLNVENCEISGATTHGLDVQTGAKVIVAHSIVRDNGYGGIRAGTGAVMHVMNSQVTNNAAEGIYINGGTSETTTINISDTVVSGSSYCIENFANTGTTGYMTVTRSSATGCSIDGIANTGANTATYMAVTNSTATRNGAGFVNASGTFKSLGNNLVEDNTINTSGTITIATPR